jgi:uncharacterized protein (TIRG00374 family)
MRIKKSHWKGFFKLLGPLFFVFLLLHVVDLNAARNALRQIDTGLAICGLLFFTFVNASLSVRWWIICRQLRTRMTFRKIFQIYHIAWFLSIIPFAAISPLAKFVYLREEGNPAAGSAVSITLDKLFDIAGLVLFSLIGILYFPVTMIHPGYLWALIIALGSLCIAAAVLSRGAMNRFTNILNRYGRKKLKRFGVELGSELSAFWSGFDARLLLTLLGISIIVGLLRSGVLYLLALSLNINVGFGLIVACRALFGVFNILPISLNGLGTREAILIPALSLSGISQEYALALGFAAFLCALCSKLSGIFFWLKNPLPINTFTSSKMKSDR